MQHDSATADRERQAETAASRPLWNNIFRAFGVSLPLLLFLLATLVLTWLGIGANTTFILPSQRADSADVFHFNMRADAAYSSIDLRGPEPRAFELPKPGDTFRVVVIGESSVQGFPYPSELAFPRHLELILNRQLPSRRVEVLNAGIVGLSSTPLVDVVRGALGCRPDAVVLYVGHNEFYGIGGVATTAPLTKLGIFLRRFRVFQWLTSFREPVAAPSETLITRLPRGFSVGASGDLVGRAEWIYRRNLSEMVRLCRASDAEILLCSVACNLRDQSPIVSELPSDETDEQLSTWLGKAETFVASGDHESALAALEAAERLVPGHALTVYRKGQCLETLERDADACDCFARARDLDACRFRALGSFRNITREIAAATERTHFVDVVEACAEAEAPRAPGSRLFLEHVHFTLDGHWIVAQGIARRIVEDVWRQPWNPERVPSAAERDAWLGVISLDPLSASILTSFVIQAPPLSLAPDASLRLDMVNADTRRLMDEVPPEQLALFRQLDHQTKIDDLVHGIGQLLLDRGDVAAALAMFERAQRRRPWLPHSFIYAALCQHLLGDDAGARVSLERARRTVVEETPRLAAQRARLEESLR